MIEIVRQFLYDGTFARRLLRGLFVSTGTVMAASNGKLPDTREGWGFFVMALIGAMIRSERGEPRQ